MKRYEVAVSTLSFPGNPSEILPGQGTGMNSAGFEKQGSVHDHPLDSFVVLKGGGSRDWRGCRIKRKENSYFNDQYPIRKG